MNFPLRHLALLAGLWSSAPAWSAHAVAQFGEPRYPANFSHFQYVNPDAPQGGRLTLSLVSANSSFDKYNPFTLKGITAPGVQDLVFETLTVNGLDEPNTQYGLLADDIRVAPDFSAVTFHLNPRARFSNGDPVTAADVLHSFQTLVSKEASPKFKAYFSELKPPVLVDAATIRFDFKRKGRDLSFVAGSLPVFSPKWGLKPDGSRTPFDHLRLEIPIGTGPYRIEKVTGTKDVIYRKNPDYWANSEPVRRGFYNFGEIAYKLYKDRDTQVAALRAGDFDFFSETQMRYWCCQYIGKRFDSGEIIKEKFPHLNAPAMNGWVLNLRREPFKDRRVREALNYAMDFEWMNARIFDNEFKRVTSYFTGTPLAAAGLPSPAELKLLEPFRAELDPAVFGPMFEQPSTRPPHTLRQNLTKALELLAQAGWHNRDGILRNARGEPFVIEITGTRGQSPFMDPIYRNLAKLGITVRKTLNDAATTRKRTREFDFDYASAALRESRMPAPELWRNFHSSGADQPGSDNLAGVKSRAVDALLQKLLEAGTPEEQQVAGRALDRVLTHGQYFIPWRYLTEHYFLYQQRLQRPATLPLYYGAYEWVLGTWWDKSVPLKQATVGK